LIVRSKHGDPPCIQGEHIKLNEIIRLQHHATRCNLHSHQHQSPLSQQQEVSCYGPEGNGDSGDNWKVLPHDGAPFWSRNKKVSFQHVDTGKYLFMTDQKFRNPIPGQREVVCSAKRSIRADFVAVEGYYFPRNN